MDFPGGSAGKEFACNTGATAGAKGLTPGSGRSPEVGNGNPLQYSRLGNPMDSGAWQSAVHWVTELDTTKQEHTRRDVKRVIKIPIKDTDNYFYKSGWKNAQSL